MHLKGRNALYCIVKNSNTVEETEVCGMCSIENLALASKGEGLAPPIVGGISPTRNSTSKPRCTV